MFNKKFNRRGLFLALSCSSLLTLQAGCSYNDSSNPSDSAGQTPPTEVELPGISRPAPSSAVGQSIFCRIGVMKNQQQ